MRQIEYDACHAFWNNERFNRSNTHVIATQGHTAFMLHTNCIAIKDSSTLTLSSCGWMTVTTKSRLNAILARTPYSIYQKNFEWFLTDGENSDSFYDGMEIKI